MRILDRYISGSIIAIFLTAIIIFSCLYILIDITSNLDDLLKRKVPLEIIFKYYSTFLPVIFSQTSPIACLIATLITFAKLNSNNEIIVMRTAGLHFWRLAKPAIYIGLVIASILFLFNERIVPEAMATAEKIRNANMILEVDSNRKRKEKIKNLTFYGLKNRLYFIDSFDPNTFELEGITVIEQDENQNPVEKTVALKGKWVGIAWKFYQCQVTIFEPGTPNTTKQVKYFDEKLMDIRETPRDFMRQRLDVAAMNIVQLSDYIKRFKHSGAEKAINNLRVDLHQKFAYPIGTIVILLVGMPLALMTTRRKALTFTSVGLAIGIGFLYYVINAVGLALGKGGLLSPIVSAWCAPALFFLTSIYLIKTKF